VSSSSSKPHHVDAHGKPHLDANGKPAHFKFDVHFEPCLTRTYDLATCIDKLRGADKNAVENRLHGFGENVEHSDNYVPPSSERFQRIAGELDGTVDEAVDVATEGLDKKSGGFWGRFKDAAVLSYKRLTEGARGSKNGHRRLLGGAVGLLPKSKGS
jgi:hypothetical protein